MQLLSHKLIARMIHTIVADYRKQVPVLINIITGAGCIIVFTAVTIIISNGFNIYNLVSILVGILLIIPRLAVSSILYKFRDLRYHVRDAIVQNVEWRGDEHVLDVGVGSGLTLFGCAKQLTTGTATGIDLYLDHSGGGTADIFWKNAKHEGLAERVTLDIEDARAMPYEDNTFDVIVSTGVMHHIGGNDDRIKASQEIVRVLRAGGRVLVFDHTSVLKELETTMRDAGFTDIQLRGDKQGLLFGNKPA